MLHITSTAGLQEDVDLIKHQFKMLATGPTNSQYFGTFLDGSGTDVLQVPDTLNGTNEYF